MKNPMEHLKRWHYLYIGTLTPNEITLYIHLFMLQNRQYWESMVQLTDSQLALGTNIAVRYIPDVINALCQKGLIICERGKGKRISRYTICPLTEDNSITSNYPKKGVIKPRYSRDIAEIKPRYSRDIAEIKPSYESGNPCGSKDSEPHKTYDIRHMTYDMDIKKKNKKEKAHSRTDVFATCDESENVKKALQDFAEMRLRMRSPMTDRAKELLLAKLDELAGGDDFMKVHLLEQSIERGWKTVYPLKADVSTAQQSAPIGDPQSGIDRAIEFFRRQAEELYD